MASAGLPPVHPEEAGSRLQEAALGLDERARGNRRGIHDEGLAAGSAGSKTRQDVAGADAPADAANALPEGSAWLSLPATGPFAPLGDQASGRITIALAPRIADAILGMLSEVVKGAKSGSPEEVSVVSSPVGQIDRLDSRPAPRPPYVRAAPDRIAGRPRPDQWRDDELLTLPEAARLFWPDGPLTTTSLRTAARDGTLEIRTVAGRHMTTPAALRRLGFRRTDGPAEGLSVTEAAASMLKRLERRR